PLLTGITEPTGAQTTISYKVASSYQNPDGTQASPQLPLPLHVVANVSVSDTVGSVTTSDTYFYKNGSYFYGGPFDRRFAGFGVITDTDALGNVTTTYFHQGNTTSNSAQGENQDDEWKIGKVYRVEQRNSSNQLLQTTINTWNDADLGHGNRFVYLSQTLVMHYGAGSSSHFDIATTYAYDNTTGNLLNKVDLGQVNGSDSGSVTDLGSDSLTTTYAYAAGTAPRLFLPDDQITTDSSANKVRESRFYYDDLPFGSASLGNVTEEDDWISGSTYAVTTKAYNSFGLITSATDPDGHTTSYSYDSLNLYPATVTNAANQAVQYLYDYTSGKISQSTDPNGLVVQTVYDGMGRPLTVTESDPANPASFVTRMSCVYTDLANACAAHQTDYLDASTAVDNYTYYDGLGRT
ncbi:MAG: toxin TcdB middle/N-terminal domain-containing protein, partial [Blastocatellia bacterium]